MGVFSSFALSSIDDVSQKRSNKDERGGDGDDDEEEEEQEEEEKSSETEKERIFSFLICERQVIYRDIE
jgi:hypothetical protein